MQGFVSVFLNIIVVDFNNIVYNFYKFFFCDRKDYIKCEFFVYDVFVVDFFISIGEGKIKEKDIRIIVYKKIENIYSLKMKVFRGIIVDINNIIVIFEVMCGNFYE